MEKPGLIRYVFFGRKNCIFFKRENKYPWQIAEMVEKITEMVDTSTDYKMTYAFSIHDYRYRYIKDVHYCFNIICANQIMYVCITNYNFCRHLAFMFLKVIQTFYENLEKPTFQRLKANQHVFFPIEQELKRFNSYNINHRGMDELGLINRETGGLSPNIVEDIHEIEFKRVVPHRQQDRKLVLKIEDEPENEVIPAHIIVSRDVENLNPEGAERCYKRFQLFGGLTLIFVLLIYFNIAIWCGLNWSKCM